MKRQRRALPSDYPIFAFRISATDKKRLTRIISEVHEIQNKRLPSEFKRLNRNDIVIKALEIGLKVLKSKRR